MLDRQTIKTLHLIPELDMEKATVNHNAHAVEEEPKGILGNSRTAEIVAKIVLSIPILVDKSNWRKFYLFQ